MAYDGYSSSYSAPKFDPGFQPQQYSTPGAYPSGPQYHDVPQQRSRASSKAASDSLPPPAQQPLKNALNHAFDQSDAARMVDSDLIAQITEEVKKSVLEEIKLTTAAGSASPLAQPQPYVTQSPVSTSASFPSRNVYTPPTPQLSPPARASPPPRSSTTGSPFQDQLSDDPLARDPMFDGADDTPTPRNERRAPMGPPPDTASRSRPAPVERMPTEGDFTPIEKMWQRLFDDLGNPTPRLGQFLRGLALHIIDDYEPKKSLVISPSKMRRFYEEVHLPDELFQWSTIFGSLPYSTLTKMYRDMRCQHHLIQDHPSDQPHVPALTPQGFQEWMTAMIQAYPRTEYERLSKAVLDMPISNADDGKDRFPKELPRRLFPQHENLQAQQRCTAALSAAGAPPRRAPTFPPPPPQMGSASLPINVERQRSPYMAPSNHRNSTVLDSDDDEPLSVPIERERKPYAAAPGGGKVYDDLSQSIQSDSAIPDQRKRAQSTATKPPHTATFPHPRTTPTTTGRRQRSPSFSGYGTKSDSNIRDIPSSYYSSNIYDSEDELRRHPRDGDMKRNDWARRQAEDGAGARSRRSTTGHSDSSYESQPRSVYDDDYYRGRSGTNGYDGRNYERRY